MKQLNLTKLAIFLILCFGMSWGSFFLIQAQVSSSPIILGILAILFVWAPGFAAILTHTFLYGESLSSLGYYRKDLTWNSWIMSRIVPIGILAVILGLIFLAGNILNIPSAGKVIIQDAFPSSVGALFFDISHKLLTAFGANALVFKQVLLNNWVGQSLNFPMVNWSSIFLVLLLTWLIGVNVGSFLLRGQELGFRGFLLNELKPKGFLGSNLLIGFIWGIYAVGPLVISKVPIPAPGGLFNTLIFTVGICVALSFPLAYLRLKSGTIRATSVFRSVFIVFSGFLFLFTWDTNLQFWGPNGFLGICIFLVITWLIIQQDKEFMEQFEGEAPAP
ncbi:MAG: hypothetical protein AAF694_02895 [Bacteroidota bacterium]